MITPKRILVFLLGLFMLGLYTLILGQGGYVRMWELSDEFAMLQEENQRYSRSQRTDDSGNQVSSYRFRRD